MPCFMAGSQMWWLGPLMMLACLLVGGLLCWLVWRRLSVCGPWSREEARSPAAETPLDILKRRYAKGELSREQFDQMKKDVEA